MDVRNNSMMSFWYINCWFVSNIGIYGFSSDQVWMFIYK